ncbi:unnamed protein product, partial [Meganyctiphanes norvegica]
FMKLDSSLSSAKDNKARHKIKSNVILFGCLYATFTEPEDNVSWRELYSYTFEELNGIIEDFDNNKDDRLTWISQLCQKINHQFEPMSSCDIQENMQGSFIELFNCLNQMKKRIHHLPDNQFKVQKINGDCLHKLDVFNVDNALKQALELTCKKKYNLFLHMLISHAGVNLSDPLDDMLKTHAIHHAAAEGNKGTVAYLLHSCNIESDVKDRFGNNAAHYAFMYGHSETGDYITAFKPELKDMKNSSEKTPLDLKVAFKDKVKKLKNQKLLDNNKELKVMLNDVYEKNNELDLVTIHLDMCLLRRKIRKLTFAELSQESLVDMSTDENKSIFKEVLGFIDQVGLYISKKNKYFQGKLIPAGSSAEECRLGAADEFDFNWVFDWGEDIKAKLEEIPTKDQALKGYTHQIMLDSPNQEIKRLLSGSNLLDQFYCAVKEALPNFFQFEDKRISVILPGVKRTGVGVNLTLAWMGTMGTLLLVDVDLLPVIKATRPDEYPHPTLTAAHIKVGDQSIIHTINIADFKWKFTSTDMDAVYINSIGNGEWRFSQTLEESFTMLNLNKDMKCVFLITKYIVSALKAEPWYPEDVKKRYWYFNSKSFKLPAPQGFLMKSAFFEELEKVPKEEYWEESWYLVRIKSIFLRMCRQCNQRDEILKSIKPNMSSKDTTKELECGKVPSYFAKETQRPTAGYLAPIIFNILETMDIKDFY